MEKLTEVKMLKNVIMGYERTYLSTDDFLCDSLPKAFVGDLFPSVEATHASSSVNESYPTVDPKSIGLRSEQFENVYVKPAMTRYSSCEEDLLNLNMFTCNRSPKLSN